MLPSNYGYKAIPNNKFKEFFIPKESIKDDMRFYEVKKGVFEYRIEKKQFTFDMNGWVKKQLIYPGLSFLNYSFFIQKEIGN